MLVSANKPEQGAMAPWPPHWEVRAGVRYPGLQRGNGNVLGFGVSERAAGKGHGRFKWDPAGTRDEELGGRRGPALYKQSSQSFLVPSALHGNRDIEGAELGMQLLHEIFSSKMFTRYRMAIARAWGFVQHSANSFIPRVPLAGEGAGGAEPPSRADRLPPGHTNEASGHH